MTSKQGFHFDTIWNGYEDDPLRFHLVVWYQYMYHVDRKMLDISPKRDAWATTRAYAYLAIHTKDILSIDTLKASWASVVNQYPAATPWKTVDHKSRQKAKSKKSSGSITNSFTTASSLLARTPSIAEEQDEATSSSTDKCKASRTSAAKTNLPPHDSSRDKKSQASSDAGMVSALILNSNVAADQRWDCAHYTSLENDYRSGSTLSNLCSAD